MINVPTELKKAICEDNLVIFVGAGLSYNLRNSNNEQFLGWGNLVIQVLNDLKKKGFDIDHLFPLVEYYDPIKVLELIEINRDIPKNQIYSFVKDFFVLGSKNDLKLHKKIFELSKKIVTTNYDTAFEESVPELRRNKAYKGRNYELTKHKEKDAVILFKLHGCFEDADSMVLFPSNYKDLYENLNRDAEHSLLVLKNIILNKTLLFIGVGIGDFQINNIFKEIKRIQGEFNQRHFIITNRDLDSSLDFLNSIRIIDFKEIELIIDELIKIKKDCISKEIEQIQELKSELEKARKEIESFKNVVGREELLKRESLKYFANGLEYTLSNEFEKSFREYETAVELNPQLHVAFNNWGISLAKYAKSLDTELAEDFYLEAFDKFKKAIEIKEDRHNTFFNWAQALTDLANFKEDQEFISLYYSAFEKYAKATEIKPDYVEAFINWGNSLGDLANILDEEKSEYLFKDAFEKYAIAIELKPDEHDAYNNWGNTLSDMATKLEADKALLLHLNAVEKYEKAIELKEDKYETYYNWGNTLVEIAGIKDKVEAKKMYLDSITKYKKAIELKEDFYEAYNNWGCLLTEFAKIVPKRKAEKLFLEAFEKYRIAIEIKGDYYEGYQNWGVKLIEFANIEKGNQTRQLYQEAIEKLTLSVKFGGDAYNLSCLCSLMENKVDALHYLNLALLRKEIEPEFVEKDSDFEKYFRDKDFKTLINNFK